MVLCGSSIQNNIICAIPEGSPSEYRVIGSIGVHSFVATVVLYCSSPAGYGEGSNRVRWQ